MRCTYKLRVAFRSICVPYNKNWHNIYIKDVNIVGGSELLMMWNPDGDKVFFVIYNGSSRLEVVDEPRSRWINHRRNINVSAPCVQHL